MDALIFDFDGVVVDSEPIHLVGFQQVLRGVGVEMTHDDYFGKYLGFDDRDCFAAALRDHGRQVIDAQIAEMTAAKTILVQKVITESIEALDGAVALIASAAEAGLPLAICSGALRKEIELASESIGVRQHFLRIVSADDVQHGKPDPEGYRMAIAQLIEATGNPIQPAKCVVVEDSPAGIDAAHAAGMKVLGVTTSYPADAIAAADRIVDSLAQVTVDSLAELI